MRGAGNVPFFHSSGERTSTICSSSGLLFHFVNGHLIHFAKRTRRCPRPSCRRRDSPRTSCSRCGERAARSSPRPRSFSSTRRIGFFGIEQPAGPDRQLRQRRRCSARLRCARRRRPASSGYRRGPHCPSPIASLKRLRRQAGHQRQIAEDLGPCGVQLLHPLVVGRLGRSRGEGVLLELLLVGMLQERIELPLVTDGARQPIADVGAARRAVPCVG